MVEKRTSDRIDCLNMCQLNHNGTSYTGILENLSHKGALFSTIGDAQLAIPTGSECSLVIDNDPVMVSGEFSGTVVYSEPYRIGLQFEFNH